jgi:hypothetical protein
MAKNTNFVNPCILPASPPQFFKAHPIGPVIILQ